jgi:hypothetical protein
MKELKGKQLTLRAKIIGAAVAIASLGLKAAGINIDIPDAIKVSLFVVAIFSTVDLSLILEKFLGKKNDNR